MRNIIIGTRKSTLALIQTNEVINELKSAEINNPFIVKEIDTKGDQNRHLSLAKVGGRGIFSNEIEHSLLNKEIDFAVHSMKDLPPSLPEGLVIAAIPKREDPRDAYIEKDNILLTDLPARAVIGTSSLRRASQLLAIRPDIQTKSIRGPVPDRLKQVKEGMFSATILAVAGLNRLGLEKAITQYLPIDSFLPAIGQGALAIQCRGDDHELKRILAAINDEDTAKSIETERQFIRLFGEDPEVPVGGYAFVSDGKITFQSAVLTRNGEKVINDVVYGTDPDLVAKEAVTNLINKGARLLSLQTRKE